MASPPVTLEYYIGRMGVDPERTKLNKILRDIEARFLALGAGPVNQYVTWAQLEEILANLPPGGGGTGVVETIVGGLAIDVDDTDPANPIVAVVPTDLISADGGNQLVLGVDGGLFVPAGGAGIVETIVEGDGISVDATDPANPEVALLLSGDAGNAAIFGTDTGVYVPTVVPGGQVDSVVPGTGIDVDNTDPVNPVVGLENTAVTPGTYGDDSQYTVFTVDATGRITSASLGGSIALDAAQIVSGSFGTSFISNDAITNAKLRDSSALSVIGRSANSTGDPADIAAASDHQVLRRSGTSLGFGAVDLTQSAAVTGALGVPNGGTGLTSVASGSFVVGNGTGAFTVRTAAQVASDIGAVPATRTLTAGTGLTGGGDLSANRTFNLANTAVTPGTYGDDGQYTSITVDAQGRITAIGLGGFISIDAGQVATGTFGTSFIDDNAITNGKLRDSAALSVIGRSVNSSGDPADITATADGQVLRRSNPGLGSALNWGAVELGNANAVSGTLPVARGGTGAATLTSGSYVQGNGTSAVTMRTPAQVWADIDATALATAQTWTANQTWTGVSYQNGGMRVKFADYTAGGTLTLDDFYAIVDGSGVTLPNGAAMGQTIVLRNFSGAVCTVNRNSNNIDGVAANYSLASNGTVRFVFFTGLGWITFAA